jgi:hypothetical protein
MESDSFLHLQSTWGVYLDTGTGDGPAAQADDFDGEMLVLGSTCGSVFYLPCCISCAQCSLLPRCTLPAMCPEPSFRLRGGRPLLSQQIVTLAFGAKHIPFGMLFIANGFGVPVIYIG